MRDQSADFEFRQHLRDTLILLGGKREIADLLLKSEDGLVTDDDVDELRSYNIKLFTEAKSRLNNLNRLRVRVSSAERSD